VDARCEPAPRLEILKALGDDTRYAIYLELARSPAPLSTSDVADTLGLHVNTVRPHLERMREVGLLDVTAKTHRGVGRPQHLYGLAPDAPSLGLEPPPFRLLADLLARLAAVAGVDPDDALAVGTEHGRLLARSSPGGDPVEVLVSQQADLGFDPQCVGDDTGCTVAFGHCPYGELAQRHPEVVCSLHQGLVEGHVDELGLVEVVEFSSLAAGTPCQVELQPV
jgi:predicted ArsR family transcriptional regulator